MSKLVVVTPYINTRRFKIRPKLYHDFATYIKSCGLELYTGELVIGDRDFEVTKPNDPYSVQIRGTQEAWFKENIQNIVVSRLPSDVTHIAFIDCDCTFVRHDWVKETMAQLDLYPVIQLWSHYLDVGPDHQPIRQPIPSFSYVYNHPELQQQTLNDMEINGCQRILATRKVTRVKSVYGAPGLAWAWRRETLDACGGLLDTNLIGAGDYQMAMSLVGKTHQAINVPKEMTVSVCNNGYHRTMLRWGERAFKIVKGNIGYTPTLAIHYYHGNKINRGYNTRWRILTENNYDPETDIVRNTQGLWVINPDRIEIIRGLNHYFSQRNEDSVDI